MPEWTVKLPSGKEFDVTAENEAQAYKLAENHVQQELNVSAQKEFDEAPFWKKIPMAAGDIARVASDAATFGGLDRLLGPEEAAKTKAAAARAGTAAIPAAIGGAYGMFSRLPSAIPGAVNAIGGGTLMRGLTGATVGAAEGAGLGAVESAIRQEDIGPGAALGGILGAGGQVAGDLIGRGVDKATKWWKGVDDSLPAKLPPRGPLAGSGAPEVRPAVKQLDIPEPPPVPAVPGIMAKEASENFPRPMSSPDLPVAPPPVPAVAPPPPVPVAPPVAPPAPVVPAGPMAPPVAAVPPAAVPADPLKAMTKEQFAAALAAKRGPISAEAAEAAEAAVPKKLTKKEAETARIAATKAEAKAAREAEKANAATKKQTLLEQKKADEAIRIQQKLEEQAIAKKQAEQRLLLKEKEKAEREAKKVADQQTRQAERDKAAKLRELRNQKIEAERAAAAEAKQSDKARKAAEKEAAKLTPAEEVYEASRRGVLRGRSGIWRGRAETMPEAFLELAQDPKRFAKFTPEQQAAIEKTIRRDPGTRLAQRIGRFGTSASGLFGTPAAGIAASFGGVGGPLAAAIGLAGPVSGVLGRTLANQGTDASVEALKRIILNKPKFKGPLSKKDRVDLGRVLGEHYEDWQE